MNNKHLVIAVAISVLAAQAVHAANKRCGVGTWIFGGSKSILSQTVENTANRSLSGASSIESGTSGCKHSGHFFGTWGMNESGVSEEELLYVNANYEELMIEMAGVQGEVMAGFAQTLGCRHAAWADFYSTTQTHYSEIFTSEKTTPEDMLINVKSAIKSNPKLHVECRSFVI